MKLHSKSKWDFAFMLENNLTLRTVLTSSLVSLFLLWYAKCQYHNYC